MIRWHHADGKAANERIEFVQPADGAAAGQRRGMDSRQRDGSDVDGSGDFVGFALGAALQADDDALKAR